MVVTRSQQTPRTTASNTGESGRDDSSVESVHHTVHRESGSKPTPTSSAENNHETPLPDSTTPPAGTGKDAVVMAANDEAAERKPAKGKRGRRKNRKRKLTAEIEGETAETTESSTISSTSSPKQQKTTETGEDDTRRENLPLVIDELQKENVLTTPGPEVEVKHNLEEEKVETKIQAVKAKEVLQLYKKESYADRQAVKPKGKPKSGRHWKTEQTQRFSGIKQDRPLKSTWQKKMQQKADMKNMKTFEAELKETRDNELDRKKKYRAKKIKRKLENQRKSEVVQVISNPAKIKRMKKKQLRNIEMRSMPDSSKKQVFKS